MAQGGDVGEEDADLAVFDAPAHATILWLDACGVSAAFGKAAFIEHQDRIERIGCSRGGRRRQQGLDEGAAQGIAHGGFVPHRAGEQALDAVGMGLARVFSDLQAVLARRAGQC